MVEAVSSNTDTLVRGTIALPCEPEGNTHELTHECRLTTYDNPFDPFVEYYDWFAWDFNEQYHTPGLLDRIIITSTDLSEADQRRREELAIDTIVRENWFGIHRKLMRPLQD